MLFPTLAVGRDVRVLGAVADTGAQVNIFPARLLQESGLQLFGLTTNKLPTVKSASGAKVRVTGAVNVQLSAAASNGERFKTTTKVYIALRALNVVNVHFPAPRNQHGGLGIFIYPIAKNNLCACYHSNSL